MIHLEMHNRCNYKLFTVAIVKFNLDNELRLYHFEATFQQFPQLSAG